MTETNNNNNKDNNERRQRSQRPHRGVDSNEPKPEVEPISATVEPEVDEDAATVEEMEAFIQSRREKRNAGYKPKYEDNADEEVPTDFEANESAMDPYLEPDPTLPKVEYKESLYLSRGCNHCPESYVPVSEVELRSCCKVGSCNWMKGLRRPMEKPFDCVEVRFKNNRKEFFRLPDGIDVSDGDIVAVEGIPGHAQPWA